MKTLFPAFLFLCTSVFNNVYSQPVSTKSASHANPNFTLFGRGIYPGDDSTYSLIKASGFTTVILSSFYIRADGDVYSGDDSKNPIIHDGEYTGNADWPKRIASLKKRPSTVTRIEILLEGRWYNQPPNTYDFIKNWLDTPATNTNDTLYKIAKIFKDKLGIDAVCIDDESVYNSSSIIKFGEMIGKLGMHMTLCPFAKKVYWKAIVDGSQRNLIDAIYLQCYDGGTRNTPAPWHDSVSASIPVYPIFLCRGSFDKCSATHNSKTPEEITAAMIQFKKDYPGIAGGAIWQMADIKNYVKMNCAAQDTSSGNATSASEYIKQLYASIKMGLL